MPRYWRRVNTDVVGRRLNAGRPYNATLLHIRRHRYDVMIVVSEALPRTYDPLRDYEMLT